MRSASRGEPGPRQWPSRAWAHYESALGVLLVARSGRDARGPELAGILEGWDGRLICIAA